FVRQLHRRLYLASAFFVFFLFYPVLYFLGKNKARNYYPLVRTRKMLASVSAAMAGFRFKTVQEGQVDWSRNYIVMANHSSILDITAVIKACPIPLSFMGKVELLDNPVTGFFFKRV